MSDDAGCKVLGRRRLLDALPTQFLASVPPVTGLLGR